MTENKNEVPGMFEGPIMPVTLKIGMPVLIANIVQVVYIITDTYFISLIDQRSTAILSGTGLIFPLMFLFMAIANSLMTGVSTVTGRIIGEKNKRAASNVSSSGFLITSVIITPTIICGYYFKSSLINLLAGNDLSVEAITYAQQYYTYLFPTFILIVIGYVIMGILLGEGKTGILAVGMLMATVLNIILDPILIFVLNMGVAGAGLATSISMLIAASVVAGSLIRGITTIPFSINIFRSQLSICREIIHIGIPQFINVATLAVSFMVLNNLVANLGEHLLNAWIIAGRTDQILSVPIIAVSAATITMASQNFGRNNLERVRKIFNHNILLISITVAAVVSIYVLIAPLIFPFFSSVPEVIDASVLQVRITAISYIGFAFSAISNSTFQSTGKSLPSIILPLLRSGLIIIPLAYILVYSLHLEMIGVYLAFLLGNLIMIPIAYFWTNHYLKNATFRSVKK